MNKKKNQLINYIAGIVLLLALLFIGVYLADRSKANKSFDVTLNFTASVAGEGLQFNQSIYPNPGGAGTFHIRDFQFYLSNVKLLAADETYHEPYTYHLARFDNQSTNYAILLKDLKRKDYQKIELSIGVDKVANSSIVVKGDLDPNNRMAWSWDVGHKFILFEGGLKTQDGVRPLVYHVGFTENYKTLTFDISPDVFKSENPELNFEVDLMAIFNAKNAIDMAQLPSIKFDRTDAKTLADNYEEMISISQ